MITSKSGEMATYRGFYVGREKESRWRGVLSFRSSTPQWARLVGSAILFEYELDGDNFTCKLWEWKEKA